jgi:type II secretory ATPase GspE/PulE/Tfp pilus assembly ATPase PilB-like protein
MGLFGKKKKVEAAAEDAPPPITLVPKGAANPRDDQANLLMAKQSPGFLIAQRLLYDALKRRAEKVLLDYTAQAVGVQYQLDGVWMNSAQLDRPSGDAMLAVMKVLAALNMNERRALQKGTFGAEYKKRKLDCKIVSQGVPTGERVTVAFDEPKAPKFQKIEELGFREGMLEQIKTLFAEPEGFILVSAPPGGGLSTCFSALLRSADRFVRNFAEVQDATNPEKAVENVPITKYDPSKGETPLTVMPKLLRTYPDVLCLRDLVNNEVMDLLIDQVPENRLVVGAIRAKSTCDALLRVVQGLKVPAEKFAPTLKGVLHQRLVRVLCEGCKVAYPPPPQQLQQLGIPQGKVAAFYRHWEGPLPPQNEKEEPRMCPKCNGLGFRGRVGVFELLIPNDDFRKALARSPKPEVLAEARKCGMRTLQEEGIVLVARGVTSLPELVRILKD